MKKLIIAALFISISTILFGQAQVNWMEWDEAYTKAKTENKILLVDLITSKCPYCVKMDKETYSNPAIIKILEKDFVCVKVNPKIGGIKYQVGEDTYTPLELLKYLTTNSMFSEDPNIKFPTTVFIMPYNNQKYVEPGFHEPQVYKYMLFNCVKAKQRLEKRLKE
jgi:thioredoxin-related protein